MILVKYQMTLRVTVLTAKTKNVKSIDSDSSYDISGIISSPYKLYIKLTLTEASL